MSESPTERIESARTAGLARGCFYGFLAGVVFQTVFLVIAFTVTWGFP